MSGRRSLTPGRRLALAIGLLGLVHGALLRFGNDDATPLRLLGSFALSTALLLVAFQLKKHLLLARSTSTSIPRDPR